MEMRCVLCDAASCVMDVMLFVVCTLMASKALAAPISFFNFSTCSCAESLCASDSWRIADVSSYIQTTSCIRCLYRIHRLDWWVVVWR